MHYQQPTIDPQVSGAPSSDDAADRSSSSSAGSLEFVSITKTYAADSKPVIKDLSLTIPAGEICVLVGPSGCGKTTAMRMVNRMVELTSGDILIDGASILNRNPTSLRREIGYVIQQTGLFPHETVYDNIATVPRLLKWKQDQIKSRIYELLELVGLDPESYSNQYPTQLSGGQQQRVGIARALAVDPALMLIDEPFGALDPIVRARLQDELLQLQSKLRKTIVFVTHDIDEAIKMGDRIVILDEAGNLVQYATSNELLLHPANEFVAEFLGADRALKRLSLLRVSDLAFSPVKTTHGFTIDANQDLRSALSMMLGRGIVAANVTSDSIIVGEITVDLITGQIRARERQEGTVEIR